MTCMHSTDDRNCSSHPDYIDPYKNAAMNVAAKKSPNPNDYEVEEIKEVGDHLVMRVRYPSCSACSYEGNKILVFLNSKPIDAIRWKRIDPHFRNPKQNLTSKKEAPSPAARFPASIDGWIDAVKYAESKIEPLRDPPRPK